MAKNSSPPSDRVKVKTNEPYPADKARQGEIILRKRWQRVVFIAGLVGCIVLLLIVRIALWH